MELSKVTSLTPVRKEKNMKDFSTYISSNMVGKSMNSKVNISRPKSVISDDNINQPPSSLPSRLASRYPTVVGIKTKTVENFYKPIQLAKVNFDSSVPSLERKTTELDRELTIINSKKGMIASISKQFSEALGTKSNMFK